MKTITRITCVVLLLAIGFAAGFPAGSTVGFTKGSEWALVQAAVLAKEAGLFMPVGFNEGMFRVIMKQPRGVYRRAWQLADKSYDDPPAGRAGMMRRAEKKIAKAAEIVSVSHDQIDQTSQFSQEVWPQTADEIVYASQDQAAQAEQVAQGVRLQSADEVVYASRDQIEQARQFLQKDEQ